MYKIYKGGLLTAVFITLFLCVNLYADNVEIYWQANTEFDLQGYYLYYGTSSRQYPNKLTIGVDTLAMIPDLQDKTEYFFSLTAVDATGNESGFSDEVTCILNDTGPLLVDAVYALSPYDITIRFNKKINPACAQIASNYSIDGYITIFKAQLLSDGVTVRLVTSLHKHNTYYNLTLDNIVDISLPANELQSNVHSYQVNEQTADTSSPTVILVSADSADHILVYFNEGVNPATATNALNYTISDQVTINSVAMPADNVVSLQTSAHEMNRVYTITVNNITDRVDSANIIPNNSVYSYCYKPADEIGPVIRLAHLPARDKIDLLFNEPLQPGSCEDISNYSINNGIHVLAAQLDSSREIIQLQTTAHHPGLNYNIAINNIKDISAAGNKTQGLNYTYQYIADDTTKPFIKSVAVIDETHIEVYFSEKVNRKRAELEQNYIINNGIQALEAEIALSDDYVRLLTTSHSLGIVYAIDVSGVQDCSLNANEIAGSCPFKYTLAADQIKTGALILYADIIDSVTINVTFNKALNQTSAANPANYTLAGGPVILAAILTDSNNTVQLKTTPHKTDQVYTLYAAGIQAQLQKDNSVVENTLCRYSWHGDDQTGSYIIQAKTINNQEIQVLFSETVERTQAEHVANYSILENIAIQSARLDGSKRIVCLLTEQHQPGTHYTLQINNITDDSPAKNPCLNDLQYSFIYDSGDNIAPFVSMVHMSVADQLQVHFSEPVNSSDALASENYLLNNTVTIQGVQMGETDNIVELQTSPLDSGIVSSLQVYGLRDLAGNVISTQNSFVFMYYPPEISGIPQLTGFETNGTGELLLNYDQELIPEIAENIDNYRINHNVSIYTATIQQPRQLKLTTSPHQDDTGYILEALVPGSEQLVAPYPYSLINTGDKHLKIVKADLLCTDVLQLTFNYPVDPYSAGNALNYTITPVNSVLSASVEPDEKTVILTTSAHVEGIPYSIQVTNLAIKDSDSGAGYPMYCNYTYLPSLGVFVRSLAKTNIETLQLGKEYYTDCNYTITAIPAELANARLIKTPNADKNNSRNDYLSLILTTDAVVYIACDSRVKSLPAWITKQFTKTNIALGVSDEPGKLSLWKTIFPAGELTLGGNSAGGASNTGSMYIILIQEIDPDLYEKGANPGAHAGSKTPQFFTLYQNYPNPFNPETTIPFEISSGMYVTLEIYDILGRKVKTLFNGAIQAGYHCIIWDGSDEYGNTVATGVYFYKFNSANANSATNTKTGCKSVVKKMLFVK